MPATLTTLRIRNLALVEELAWELEPGLVSVTGETGAGKSVILGALKLLIGERADKSLIRSGAEQCVVEGVFSVQNPEKWNARLEENGVEPCADGELIIKRTLASSGNGRQFVNGSPTTLALLKMLGDGLVDLHGPHDHQSLFSAEQQLVLLDSYGQALPARAAFLEIWKRLESARQEKEQLAADESALERELDLLRHQVNEIESANLRDGEEEEAEARYRVAANSRRLIEIGSAITGRLADTPECVVDQLAETQKLFRELERLDPSMAELAKQHEAAAENLRDVARDLERYIGKLDLDPEQMAMLENRVNLLQGLKRKYGTTIRDVMEFGEKAAARLGKISSRGEELERLEQEIAKFEKELRARGDTLSAVRKKAAPKLAAEVREHLKDLGFAKAGFSVDIAPREEPVSSGYESVEFSFAPNPGEPPKPLRAIASSGEISRVMLAIKSALAAQDDVGLLVFDEIDANVGGEIAVAVGAKMKSLAAQHQVLCITHLPQVAASADFQFVVVKEMAGGRTVSRLSEVAGEERVRELARMLGGQSDSALSHARALLAAERGSVSRSG